MIGGLHNLTGLIRFSKVSAEPSGTSAHGEGIGCRTPMKMAPVRILHMKKWRKGFLECSRTSCKKRQQRRMGCKRGTMNKWKKGKKGPTKEARPPNKGRCWVSPSLRFSSAFSLFLYFLLFIRFFSFLRSYFLPFSGNVKWWQQMRALQRISIHTCFSFQQVFQSFPTFPPLVIYYRSVIVRWSVSMSSKSWRISGTLQIPENDTISKKF